MNTTALSSRRGCQQFSRASLLVACLASGCGGPPEASAAGRSFVVDGPDQCLNAGAIPDEFSNLQDLKWVREMDGLVDGSLQRSACSTKTAGRMKVALEFDRYGNPLQARLVGATFSECEAVECLKADLARVVAPPIPVGENARYVETVVVTPSTAPRRASSAERLASTESNTVCAAEPLPSENPEPALNPVPPEEMDDVIVAATPRFRACYWRGWMLDNRSTGTITVRLIVGRDGQVTATRVTANTLPNCEVVKCVADTIGQLQFPPPQGGPMMAVYPIHLLPTDDAMGRIYVDIP